MQSQHQQYEQPQYRQYPQQHHLRHHQQHHQPESSDRHSHLTVDSFGSADYFSDNNTGSTALTSPSLQSPRSPHSPKFAWGAKRLSHVSATSGNNSVLSNIAEALETRPLGLSPPPPDTVYDASFSSRSSAMYAAPNFEVHQTSRPTSHHSHHAEFFSTDDSVSQAPSSRFMDSTPRNYHHNEDQGYTSNDYNDDPPPGLAPAPEDVRRGPSVRSRASEYEASMDHSHMGMEEDNNVYGRSALSIPQTHDSDPPRSASPRLRLPPSPVQGQFALPGPPSPGTPPRALPTLPAGYPQTQPRALPLPPASPTPTRPSQPFTEPPARANYSYEDALSPTSLSRGSGSARRMIEAWESGSHSHDLDESLFPVYEPEHHGSLEVPTDQSTKTSKRWSMDSFRMPLGGIRAPSPLGTNTPLAAASPPSLNTSTWSQTSDSRKRKNRDLSPAPTTETRKNSPLRSPFKRSPFKGMVDAVKGFRNKHKGKDHDELEGSSRSFMNLDDEVEWFAQPTPMSANPTGQREEIHDPTAIRSTAIIYLPAPGADLPDTWMTSWATLTSDSLKITNAPLRKPTDSPLSRIQMNLAVPYSHIPRPEYGAHPMVVLPMVDCVEVRSLRKDEIRGRRIPSAPEGVGTEVLELLFGNGSKEYIGVEGVAGRLSWVSAIWDVVLASKKGQNAPNQPPSPSFSTLRNRLRPLSMPEGSHDPPVQKMGDQWIKSGNFVGESVSVQNTPDLNNDYNSRSRFPSMDADMAGTGYMNQALPVPSEERMEVDAPGLRDLGPAQQYQSYPAESSRARDLPTVPAKQQDFEPVEDMARPTVTLPLNVQKRSAPTSPNTDAPPPLPPKKYSIVEQPSPRDTPCGATTVRRKMVPSDQAPKTPERRPAMRMPRTEPAQPQNLHENLVQMFNQQGEQNYPASEEHRRRLRSQAMEDRIRAWQPQVGDVVDPLTRAASTREAGSVLSFDDSDLNPSRSASQVRKTNSNSTIDGEERALTGLGLGMTSTAKNLANIPPVTRKKPPMFKDDPPQRFEQAVIEQVPKDQVHRFAVKEMPKPSRVLATRESSEASRETPSTELVTPTTKSTSSSKASATPRGPRAALPKVSSAPRTPPSRPGSTLPKVTATRSPSPRLAAELPDVPLESPVDMPLQSPVEPAPSVPPPPTRTRVSTALTVPPRSSTATEALPPISSVKESSFAKSAPTTPVLSRGSTPALAVPPRTTTPGSRVLAAAAMFEQRNIGAPPSPSPVKLRKAAFESGSVAEGASRFGAGSALATASRIETRSVEPTPKTLTRVVTPPRSGISVASTRLSSTPSRSVLTPVKLDTASIRAAANAASPYSAARAALRPTGAARTEVSDKPAFAFNDAPTRGLSTQPTGLGLFVSKTPDKSVISRVAELDNASSSGVARTGEAEADSASVVSSRLSVTTTARSVKTSSVLADRSVTQMMNVATTETASEVKSNVSAKDVPVKNVTGKKIGRIQSPFLTGELSNPPSIFPNPQDKQQDRSTDPPPDETWFRDRASCGEAENEVEGTSYPPGAAHPALLRKMRDHTEDHRWLSGQIDSVAAEVSALTAMLGGEAMGEVGRGPLHPDLQGGGDVGNVRSLHPELVERFEDLSTNVRDMHESVRAGALPYGNEELAIRLDALDGEVREVHNLVQESAMQLAALAAAQGVAAPVARELAEEPVAHQLAGEPTARELATEPVARQIARKPVPRELVGSEEAGGELAAEPAVLADGAEEEVHEKGLPPAPTEELIELAEPQLPEVHAKLDAIAHLIQAVISRQNDLASATAAMGAGAGVMAARNVGTEEAPKPAAAAKQLVAEDKPTSAPLAVPESAAIVPDAPKAAPKATTTNDEPKEKEAAKEEAPAAAAAEPLATAAQLGDVQSALKELEAARSVQAQQTADIARYLADLNGWLEKFVQNSGSELEGMSRKINHLVGDPGEGDTPSGLVADIHTLVSEQGQQVNIAAQQAERLDQLLGYMGSDRERHSQQQGMIEQILTAANQQREDTANLLSAVAVDLTNEIKGERVRFIDSMRDATTMNMQVHVDEFKKALTQETQRSLKELGTMREQKKALEHQIADLFALKAKHGDAPAPSSPAPEYPPPHQAPTSPQPPQGRALPMPPQ